MSRHSKSNPDIRRAKYKLQFSRTRSNKLRHISRMKLINPNFPNKKEVLNG